MQRATRLMLILLSLLLFANAHAFNGSGGKMGMPQPTAEEAGDGKMADMDPEVVGAHVIWHFLCQPK